MDKLNEIEFEFLDLLLVLARNKKRLIIVFTVFLVFSYLSVFVLVKPEFVANATIISSGESNSNSGLMALAGKFSGVLPALSNGISSDGEFGLYTTILMSRVSMENVIDRFDLMKKYKFKNREMAVKALRKRIGTDVTMDNAYVISSTFQDPNLASEVANYLVQYLNTRVIEINITKSKNDRLFLEKRLEAIKMDLKNAEDSLKAYQEKNGMFEAKSQSVALLERFSKIESEWAKKDLEARVKKELMGEQSNEFKTAKIASLELKKDIDFFKNTRTSSLNALPLDSLPKSVLGYYRLYRNVEVYAAMLQYIFPVFEQARFNEQKMTPVMNVIDNAVPPIKRAFPQRTIMAILIAAFITLCAFLWLVVKEVLMRASNPKLEKIKAELFGSRA